MSVYSRIGKARIRRSVMDLSYEHKTTCNMGELIPLYTQGCIPGDIFRINCDLVIRFAPLIAPVLHEVNAYVHFFFVPHRLLSGKWDQIITGGDFGNSNEYFPTFTSLTTNQVYNISSYLGCPWGVTLGDEFNNRITQVYHRAYGLIWDQYYRDQNLQDELCYYESNTNKTIVSGLKHTNIQRRNWRKDYFTSALPWRQRGESVGLPITGVSYLDPSEYIQNFVGPIDINSSGIGSLSLETFNSSNLLPDKVGVPGASPGASSGLSLQFANALAKLKVNANNFATFDVSELRLAVQTQRWLERNARAGVRLKEFIMSHFGVDMRDYRIQRPEYIGGVRVPVIFSEVLQTSETTPTRPQGSMAGHGISVSSNRVGKYRCSEYGVILGILSVMPKAGYSNVIEKEMFRATRFDFYFPEFAHLSEQPVYQKEIRAVSTIDANTENNRVFGYQGIYNEMRSRYDLITGMFNPEINQNLSYWHFGRRINGPSQSTPVRLNASFISVNYAEFSNCFAVPDQPQCFVSSRFGVRAVRPMPIVAEPGLVDH